MRSAVNAGQIHHGGLHFLHEVACANTPTPVRSAGLVLDSIGALAKQ